MLSCNYALKPTPNVKTLRMLGQGWQNLPVCCFEFNMARQSQQPVSSPPLQPLLPLLLPEISQFRKQTLWDSNFFELKAITAKVRWMLYKHNCIVPNKAILDNRIQYR